MQLAGRPAIIPTMRVMIDTDPGGDDAIALLWLASLARQGRIELCAVSTAGGNVGAARTWRNASGLMRLCGLGDLPVAIGGDPGKVRDAADVHGSDGIGGLADSLPDPGSPAAPPASLDLLAAELGAAGEPLSLLAVAPLSNLAHLERTHPGLLAGASQLIVMGGSLGGGNVTPHAEFNFYFDAPAADEVLGAGAKTRLVTLETSTRLRLGKRRVADIVAGREQQPCAVLFARLCAFMAKRDRQFNPDQVDDGFPVHDAATVAWLAYPEFFQARRAALRIDTTTGDLQGRLQESSGGHEADVATKVAAGELLDQLGADLSWLFDDLAAAAL